MDISAARFSCVSYEKIHLQSRLSTIKNVLVFLATEDRRGALYYFA